MSVNSLIKNNFQRVRLIEARNDLIPICEASLSGQIFLLCDKSVLLPRKMLIQNILVTSNYPGNMWKLANVTPRMTNN